MAVRFDAVGDLFSRSTSLPTITSFTMMAWCKISVDRNAFSLFFRYGDTTGAGHYAVGGGTDGTTLSCYNGVTLLTGSALTVGAWNHVAITVAGTGAGQFLTYLNGVLNITNDGDTAPSAQLIELGNDPDGDFLNGCLAAVKAYSAVLTAAEIVQEMRQYLPVRTANINGFYPLLSTVDDEVDRSGQGNTLTVGGTLATEDGPPIPWKSGRRRVFLPAVVGGGEPPLTANLGEAVIGGSLF